MDRCPGTRLMAAAALVVVTSTATPAGAGSGGSAERLLTVRISSTFVEPSPMLDGFSCRGLSTGRVAEDTCRGRVTGVSYFSGTMHGTERYDLDSWLRADGRVAYEGPAVFSESGIAGCGRGGFVIEAYDGIIDYPGTDLTTRETTGSSRWRIRPGSGTGELAGRLVGGGGVNTWVSRTERTGTTENDYGEGVLTGTVTCRR